MKTIELFIIVAILLNIANSSAQTVLLSEDFETGNFVAKGWYDGFPDQRTTTEFKNGSHSFQGNFTKSALTSGAGRHLFTPTDRVYMSYWVKYSTNWVGSGVGYHPHEWSILTTEDDAYRGPADTYLTLYIEQNAGRPILAIQDSRNVDPNCILLNNNSYVGCNGSFSSYSFTENRSVCSCNGIMGYFDRRDCFASPGSTKGYYSSRIWDADSVYFRSDAGPYYKNNWHFIETYFELNSIKGGVGVPNGKIRYWYDGKLLIASDSILFRTAIHPNMKFNQLLYVPYIGVGSPINQTWWVDDLIVADGRISTGFIYQISSNAEINIFPNPSDGEFTIESIGNIDFVEVYNVLGEKVYTSNVNQKNSVKIDLSFTLKGIHLVKVYTMSNIYFSKVLIK